MYVEVVHTRKDHVSILLVFSCFRFRFWYLLSRGRRVYDGVRSVGAIKTETWATSYCLHHESDRCFNDTHPPTLVHEEYCMCVAELTGVLYCCLP